MSGESIRPAILIVEDDDFIREILSPTLASAAFVTHLANDGVMGLEQFHVTLPDLMILNVKMPRMDGWETLKELRKISDCPVIMLTVFGSTKDITHGLELGADDYLVKPFGIRELIARVDAVLRRASPLRT